MYAYPGGPSLQNRSTRKRKLCDPLVLKPAELIHGTPLSILLSIKSFSLSLSQKSLSHVRLFATPWTVAHQAPPSMEFSRREYWSGLPFPSPGDLPNPGIKPGSPALQADALTSEPN